MKNFYLIITTILLSSTSIFSQDSTKKITSNSRIGLNLNLIGISNGYHTNGTIVTGTPNETLGKISYGKSIGVHYGYELLFNKNIGIDQEVTLLFGLNSNYKSYSTIVDGNYENYTGKTRANVFMYSPKVVIKSDLNKYDGNIYARFGVQLGYAKIDRKVNAVGYDLTGEDLYRTTSEWETTGKMAKGFVADFGYKFKEVNSKGRRFFLELEYSNLSMKPTKSKMFYINNEYGFGFKHLLNESQKSHEFVDQISSTDNTDPTKPFKLLAYPLNFSYLGLKVGMEF